MKELAMHNLLIPPGFGLISTLRDDAVQLFADYPLRRSPLSLSSSHWTVTHWYDLSSFVSPIVGANKLMFS